MYQYYMFVPILQILINRTKVILNTTYQYQIQLAYMIKKYIVYVYVIFIANKNFPLIMKLW